MDFKKRRKNQFTNYSSNQKKRRQFTLEVGMKGFLCTCNFRERDCIRDAYKLLNAFAEDDSISNEEMVPESFDNKGTEANEQKSVEDQDDNDDDDISTVLSKEINELRAESEKPVLAREFQVVDTGVQNLIFIKTTVSSPLQIVTRIIKDLDSTKQQRSRFLLRLLPIEAVCKAYMDDIRTTANVIFEKYFSQEPKTFCIVFNRHCNNVIQRVEIIEDLAEIITKKNPGNKANLTNPEIAVVVEIVRNLCLIAIAPDYFRYKKYNLLEICNVKEDKNLSEKKNLKETETMDKTEDELPKDADELQESVAKETDANNSSMSVESQISQ